MKNEEIMKNEERMKNGVLRVGSRGVLLRGHPAASCVQSLRRTYRVPAISALRAAHMLESHLLESHWPAAILSAKDGGWPVGFHQHTPPPAHLHTYTRTPFGPQLC